MLSDDSGSDIEKTKKKTAVSDSEEDKDEGEKNLVSKYLKSRIFLMKIKRKTFLFQSTRKLFSVMLPI